jgi:hypothetical protein
MSRTTTNTVQHPEHGEVDCDRCLRNVSNSRLPDGGMTAGYYVVTGQSGWAEFANPGEQYVCDACMWSDPRYAASYLLRGAQPCS